MLTEIPVTLISFTVQVSPALYVYNDIAWNGLSPGGFGSFMPLNSPLQSEAMKLKQMQTSVMKIKFFFMLVFFNLLEDDLNLNL